MNTAAEQPLSGPELNRDFITPRRWPLVLGVMLMINFSLLSLSFSNTSAARSALAIVHESLDSQASERLLVRDVVIPEFPPANIVEAELAVTSPSETVSQPAQEPLALPDSEDALPIPKPSPVPNYPRPIAPQPMPPQRIAPPPVVGLVLLNPCHSGGAISFALDGRIVTLQAGEHVQLAAAGERKVEFHRGDDFGVAEFHPHEGIHLFAVGVTGWTLEPGDSHGQELLSVSRPIPNGK